MRWLWCIAVLGSVGALRAQRSPFNGLDVLPADSTGHYRIIIGGHFHGESTNRSGYPASTLLANLDTINSLGANLFLSTGDLYMDARSDSARYAKALFSKLHVPFFNAPGNHDRSSASSIELPKAYTIGLGSLPALGSDGLEHVRAGLVNMKETARDSSFRKAGLRLFQEAGAFNMDSTWLALGACVVFDLEQTDGALSKVQMKELEFWRTSLEQSDGPELPKNFFIISHRPIWSEDDPQYTDLFKDNTRSLTGTNFQKEVYPILQEIAKHAHVYWVSGSLGGDAPSSIFFQQHAPNITFIQCAIRDLPRDALLIADVYPDSVAWSALSLTGQQLLAPEAYDAAWWREHIGKPEPFNWRLLPYLIRKTVTRPDFWWGAALSLVLVLLVRRLLRRG